MAGLSLHRKLSISVHRRSENLVGSVIFGMKLWAINVWKNSCACIFVFTLSGRSLWTELDEKLTSLPNR